MLIHATETFTGETYTICDLRDHNCAFEVAIRRSLEEFLGSTNGGKGPKVHDVELMALAATAHPTTGSTSFIFRQPGLCDYVGHAFPDLKYNLSDVERGFVETNRIFR